MAITPEKLEMMNKSADKAIIGWTFGAFAANLLPPPFDIIAVGAVFAKLGKKMGEIYGVDVSYDLLMKMGRSMAKGIGAVVAASYIGSGLFKYIPGVNIWVALLIQPPIVAAISYSVGHAFKEYFNVYLTDGINLTVEQMKDLAEGKLRSRLGKII